MLSKSTIKLIHSLDKKKFRKESRLFVAEGGKTVCDLLETDIKCKRIIATTTWLSTHNLPHCKAEVTETTDEEFAKISFLRTPQGIMGIFEQPNEEIDESLPMNKLCLALDEVQDPGNLGTIVRIADWFGIEHIFCSEGCADIFNPKTVQATMGAIGRVKIYYTNLPDLLSRLQGKAPIYGTFLDGENIYNKHLAGNGIIVMGNEGNGISNECAASIDERLYIPSYPIGRSTSESLNVSTATAIICAEFRRRG